MTNRTCTVDGCSKPLASRGICHMHAWRMRTHGSFDTPQNDSNRPLKERFWAKVDKTETCWLWTGQLADNGYGKISVSNRGHGVHRISWLLAGGDLPDGMTIDHICHVRHCVRPDHLRLATPSQNSQNHWGDTHRPSKSGVRGVHPFGNRWEAKVTVDRVTRYCERFDTLEEAAAAVVAARLALHSHNDVDRLQTTA